MLSHQLIMCGCFAMPLASTDWRGLPFNEVFLLINCWSIDGTNAYRLIFDKWESCCHASACLCARSLEGHKMKILSTLHSPWPISIYLIRGGIIPAVQRVWQGPRLITRAATSDRASHRSSLKRERDHRGGGGLIRRVPNPAPVVRITARAQGHRDVHTTIHHRERSDCLGAITSYCLVLCLSFTLTLFGGEIY